jgi:membrane-associated phospholipid phosphatase
VNRAVAWTIVIASLIFALLFARFQWGGVAPYVLALLPTLLAVIAARSLLAGAVVFLLPVYFVIGQATADWPHHRPSFAIDAAMPLSPPWIFVYASLYVCGFLLPLLVVRGRALVRQTFKAYLFVMLVSYVGFVLYPTVAPRVEPVRIRDFADWLLQVFYDLDQPYGCFPSLHVAYSFVGAFACLRMDRTVGLFAFVWAALIAVATVYTKQHYAIDALAGVVVAFAGAAIFLRRPAGEDSSVEDRLLAPGRALFAVAAYLAAVAVFWIAYRMGLGPY